MLDLGLRAVDDLGRPRPRRLCRGRRPAGWRLSRRSSSSIVAGNNLLHERHVESNDAGRAQRVERSVYARDAAALLMRRRLASPLAARAPPGGAGAAAGRRRRRASRARTRSRRPSSPNSPAMSPGRPRRRPRPAAPFQLCVVGGDPFGRLLDEAARGQQIDGHPLPVRRLAARRPGRRLPCRLRPGRHARRYRPAAAGAARQPVLTVTDARAGAAARHDPFHHRRRPGPLLHRRGGRRPSAGLAISSRLLALAAGVRQRR